MALRYVDSSVVTSGNGQSWATAWKNVSNITGLTPGDTVYFSGGSSSQTYNVSNWIPTSGNSTSRISYLVGTDAGKNGTVIFNVTGNFLNGAFSYVTIDGLVNGARHISVQNAGFIWKTSSGTSSHNILRGIDCPSMKTAMYFLDATIVSLEIDNCAFHKVYDSGALNDAVIQYLSGTTGYEHRIHNCYFAIPVQSGSSETGDDCIKWGSHIEADHNVFEIIYGTYPGDQHSDVFQVKESFYKIHDNTFIGVGESLVYHDQYLTPINATDLYFYDNLCIHSTNVQSSVARGLDLQPEAGGVGTTFTRFIVANNTWVDWDAGVFLTRFDNASYTDCFNVNNAKLNCSPGDDIDTGVTSAHNVSATGSSFVNYTLHDVNNDLHLIAGAVTLIDQAQSMSSYFSDDYDGNARPVTGWDIGAYEYQSGRVPEYIRGVWGPPGSGSALPGQPLVISEALTNNKGIVGLNISRNWSEIQPNPDVLGVPQFDWHLLDADIQAAQDAGYDHVNLVVTHSTNDLPDWLLQDIIDNHPSEYILLRDPGNSHSTYCDEIATPVYWGATFLSRRLAMIAVFGARYTNNPMVHGTMMSFMNHNSMDWNIQDTQGFLTNCPKRNCTPNTGPCDILVDQPAQWNSVGFTRALMLDVGKQMCDAVAAAFPNQVLKLPIGGLNDELAQFTRAATGTTLSTTITMPSGEFLVGDVNDPVTGQTSNGDSCFANGTIILSRTDASHVVLNKLPTGNCAKISLPFRDPDPRDPTKGASYSTLAWEIVDYVSTKQYNNRFYIQRNIVDRGWINTPAIQYINNPPGFGSANYIKYMIALAGRFGGLQVVANTVNGEAGGGECRMNEHNTPCDAPVYPLILQDAIDAMETYGQGKGVTDFQLAFMEFFPQDVNYDDPVFFEKFRQATLDIGGSPRGEAKAQPIGLYDYLLPTERNLESSPILEDPSVKGVRIELGWNEIQASNSATFDWFLLDDAIAKCAAKGKKIGVSISFGEFVPDWAYSTAPLIYKYALDPLDTKVNGNGFSPPPWDKNFIAKLTTFLNVAGQRYDSNPVISYWIITGFMQSSELSMVRVLADGIGMNEIAKNPPLGYSGLTAYSDIAPTGVPFPGETGWAMVAGYLEGSSAIMQAFKNAFPTTPILLTTSEVPFDNGITQSPSAKWNKYAATQVGNYCVALDSKSGITANNLQAAEAPYPPISPVTYPRGFRAISKSTDPSFYSDPVPNPLPNIGQRMEDLCETGISKGTKFIEIFTSDMLDPNAQIQLLIEAARFEFLYGGGPPPPSILPQGIISGGGKLLGNIT